MKKTTWVVFGCLILAFAWLVPSYAIAAEPHVYYVIGTDPIEPDRTVRQGECMAKWDAPVPGLMQTRFGFKGSKSLAPLTPIIFPAEFNGKVIPARTHLVLWQCGNGFIPAIDLDTSRAIGIQCYEATAPPPPPTVPQPAQVVGVPRTAPKPTLSLQATWIGQDVAGMKVKRGSQVRILWDSQFTSECHALGGVGLNTDSKTSGEFLTPHLKHDETYIFECTGLGGSVMGRVYIDINNHNVLWATVGLIVAGAIVEGVSGGSGHSEAVRPGSTIP